MEERRLMKLRLKDNEEKEREEERRGERGCDKPSVVTTFCIHVGNMIHPMVIEGEISE